MVAARIFASSLKEIFLEGTKYPSLRVRGIIQADSPEFNSYQGVLPGIAGMARLYRVDANHVSFKK